MALRDLLMLTIVCAGALYALRHPWVGAMMWTWVSLMYPHEQFTYAAASWPVAQIVAIGTLLGLLLTKDRRPPLDRPAYWALLLFALWITLTLPFSLNFSEAVGLWERSIKIFLMLFVTIALIDSRRKLEVFIWICALSIAFYGVKGGVFTIVHQGTYRVWGPGGFIGGNNEVALAIVMVIPLLRYLQLQATSRWVRHGLTGVMILCALGALGSHSRGALVAIAAMVLALWVKSRGKLMGGALMLCSGLLALSMMPEHWWDRMHTIRLYQEDDSALGRLNAWAFAWNLAVDRFIGGGFNIYSPDLFAIYSPDPTRVHAAHSIYFQVLGEQGFPGLALFLLIGMLTWIDGRKLMRLGKADLQRFGWAADLGRMIHVSMIGYATGGAFLSLTYWDMPYNLIVMAGCALHIASREALHRQGNQVNRDGPPLLRHPSLPSI